MDPRVKNNCIFVLRVVCRNWDRIMMATVETRLLMFWKFDAIIIKKEQTNFQQCFRWQLFKCCAAEYFFGHWQWQLCCCDAGCHCCNVAILQMNPSIQQSIMWMRGAWTDEMRGGKQQAKGRRPRCGKEEKQMAAAARKKWNPKKIKNKARSKKTTKLYILEPYTTQL